MDDNFTRQLQDWLALDPSERSVEEGALLLLRLNRNRVLYRNILARPAAMHSKLEYELRKHLRIRLDGKTLRDLLFMERTVIPAADATLRQAQYRGRRADHDQLPDEVKALYERGGELYRKIRQTRESLRALEKAQPCDRYELCKLLADLDREYRQGWDTYDHYQAPASAEATPTPSPTPSPTGRKKVKK